jgi:hypothetical protein
MRARMGKASNVAEIVSAAQALEDEVAGLEALSRAARKIRLGSDKNIARAAAALKETLALPERLAERLQSIAAALGRLQERQQAALEPLTAFAAQLQERTQRLETHMQTFGALGKAASELNELLAAGEKDRVAFARAEARLREIADGARALFEAARADDFPDVAREADVLKQRMTALLQRLPRGPKPDA